MMAMGCYSFAVLRSVFGAEPEECVEATTNSYTDGIHDKCDWDFRTKWRFPNGGVGVATSTLRGPTAWKPSHVQVTMRQVVVPDKTLPRGQEKLRKRQVTLHGYIQAIAWHRIDIIDSFEVKQKGHNGKIIKHWTERTSRKAYSFKEAGADEFKHLPGEEWWMSYRYQLEQFVDRVKGRKTSTWVEGDDSVANMQMVDMAYRKCGLGVRPSGGFKA